MINDKLSNLRRALIYFRDKVLVGKMYMMRSANYISLANLGMIMFLTVVQLKDMGIVKWDISAYIIPLYFITFLLLIIFGYIDIHILKGYSSEVTIVNKVTPLHPDLASLKAKVDYLYDKEIRKNLNMDFIEDAAKKRHSNE